MKKLISIAMIIIAFAACNSNTGTTSNSKTSSDTSALKMPYTADYSSDFSIGSDSNALVALNSYKAWEEGDMNAFKSTFADSFKIDFPSGYTFNGTLDSLMKMATMYRDSLSNVKIDMDAWVSLHANDKNANWVLVWYTETDTYKTGRVDSGYFEDDNLIENGKIRYVDSHMRKLK